MSGKNYGSPGEAKKKLPGDALKELRKALANAQVRIHGLLAQGAPEATPRFTGAMRRAWKSVPADPRTAAEAMKPSLVVNTDPAVRIINEGPHKNKHAYLVRRGTSRYRVPAGARQIGSRKAPLGIALPVMRKVRPLVDGIVQAEIDKQGGGGGE